MQDVCSFHAGENQTARTGIHQDLIKMSEIVAANVEKNFTAV